MSNHLEAENSKSRPSFMKGKEQQEELYCSKETAYKIGLLHYFDSMRCTNMKKSHKIVFETSKGVIKVKVYGGDGFKDLLGAAKRAVSKKQWELIAKEKEAAKAARETTGAFTTSGAGISGIMKRRNDKMRKEEGLVDSAFGVRQLFLWVCLFSP